MSAEEAVVVSQPQPPLQQAPAVVDVNGEMAIHAISMASICVCMPLVMTTSGLINRGCCLALSI